MKRNVLLISSILMLGNCSNSVNVKTDQHQIESTGLSDENMVAPISFYLTDTTNKKSAFVKLTVIDTATTGEYLVEWGNEAEKWQGNLTKKTDKVFRKNIKKYCE